MLRRSNIANQNSVPATPRQAGTIILQHATIDLSAGVTAAEDLLNMAIIPAGLRIIRMTTIATGLPAGLTADIGTLTSPDNDPYNADVTLEPADVFLSGHDVAESSETDAPMANLIAVPRGNYSRSIGLEVSTDIPAGAGQSLQMIIEYAAL